MASPLVCSITTYLENDFSLLEIQDMIKFSVKFFSKIMPSDERARTLEVSFLRNLQR